MEKYCCTIVSISNNLQMTNAFINDLKKQKDVEYQLVIIDNTQNCFGGAREAFNSIIKEIENDTVVFLHPDIRFLSNRSLVSILKDVEELQDYGVIGVAGCPEGSNWCLLSNIYHGEGKVKAGQKIVKSMEVQTVDECFFIMNKNIIRKMKFTSLKGWHLYAVEQCLRMMKFGKRNYVVSANLWHLSDGKSLDPKYMKCLEKLIDMYKGDVDYINTTVKQWKTHGLKASIYRRYYYIKQCIKKVVVKNK